MMRLDEYDLECSRDLEARLDRDEEREPRWTRPRPARRSLTPKEPSMFTATTCTIHAAPDTTGSYVKPWIFPLPELGQVKPATVAIASEHVELGYPRGASLPQLVPVLAVHDGVCAYAGKSGDAFALCIDHPGGWSTQYGNLNHMFFTPTDRFRRRRKQRVRAGDAIGYARSPVRVRFTLAKLTDADESLAPVDPSSYMKQWVVLSWASTPSAPARAIHDLAA